MKKIYPLIVFSMLIFSCNSGTPSIKIKDSIIRKNITTERTTINSKPVRTYHETKKSFETTDEFNVGLYETKSVFRYLIKVSYKNLEVEDTLRIPNFGIIPIVDISKGDTRPSCIVGFLDKDSSFKESKLIYFEDDMIKIHVLKYYGVSTTRTQAN